MGVIAVMGWVGVTMTAVFFLIKKTIGLRVSRAEEVAGLDITEHGVSSYADFMLAPAGANFKPQAQLEDTVPVEMAIPVTNSSRPNAKITKVAIVTSQSKFEGLKSALDQIGISGTKPCCTLSMEG